MGAVEWRPATKAVDWQPVCHIQQHVDGMASRRLEKAVTPMETSDYDECWLGNSREGESSKGGHNCRMIFTVRVDIAGWDRTLMKLQQTTLIARHSSPFYLKNGDGWRDDQGIGVAQDVKRESLF
jgi:hypothetical protein